MNNFEPLSMPTLQTILVNASWLENGTLDMNIASNKKDKTPPVS